MNNMNIDVIWGNFYRLDSLDLSFVGNATAEKAIIFCNDTNQIAISVKVKIVDKNNQPLIIPSDELLKHLHLVYFRNGEPLNRENNSSNSSDPWVYSEKSKGYTNVPSFDIAFSNSKVVNYAAEQEVIFYLSSKKESSIDIAAGIYIPEVGYFNTSQNGTNTKNGPGGREGSPYIVPKKRHIEALEEIVYDKSNTELVASPLVFKNNFNWASRFWARIFKSHNNGKVEFRSVQLKPKAASKITGFDSWHFSSGGKLTNSSVNRGPIEWDYDNEVTEDAFSCIRDGSQKACAIIHKSAAGAGNNDNHVNMWFFSSVDSEASRKHTPISVNGQYFVVDSNYTYRAAVYTSDSQYGDEKIPELYLYKFVLPTCGGSWQTQWVNAVDTPTISVTDKYGNTGKIKFGFNDGEHFDLPGII